MMRKKWHVLGISLAIGMFSGGPICLATTPDFRLQAAHRAMQAGDQERQSERNQPAAREGNAQAQFQLGSILARQGGKKMAEAVRWYEEAARNGHVAAMTNLAAVYYDGEGIDRDYAKAAKQY